jgi:hypothetical protein
MRESKTREELLIRLENNIKSLLDQYKGYSVQSGKLLLHYLVITAHSYGIELADALNSEILRNFSMPITIKLDKDDIEKVWKEMKEGVLNDPHKTEDLGR